MRDHKDCYTSKKYPQPLSRCSNVKEAATWAPKSARSKPSNLSNDRLDPRISTRTYHIAHLFWWVLQHCTGFARRVMCYHISHLTYHISRNTYHGNGLQHHVRRHVVRSETPVFRSLCLSVSPSFCLCCCERPIAWYARIDMRGLISTPTYHKKLWVPGELSRSETRLSQI